MLPPLLLSPLPPCWRSISSHVCQPIFYLLDFTVMFYTLMYACYYVHKSIWNLRSLLCHLVYVLGPWEETRESEVNPQRRLYCSKIPGVSKPDPAYREATVRPQSIFTFYYLYCLHVQRLRPLRFSSWAEAWSSPT